MGWLVSRLFLALLVVFLALTPAYAAGDGKDSPFFDRNYAKSPFFEPEKEDPQADVETPADKILKDFGDPELDPPINVVENAPKPFKAFMSALDSGDKKLAFKYAKQYARYMKRLQGRLSDVVGMVGIAQETEGVTGVEDWQSSPEFNKYRYLLKDDLKEEDLEISAEVAKRRSAVEKEQANLELLERAKANEKMAGKAPVDPKARVDVLFFFSPEGRFTPQMLAEIDKLRTGFSDDPRVRISAFYVSSAPVQDLAQFQKEHDISFAIKPDTAGLHTKFKIKELPATVLVSPGTSQGVVEEGFRRSFYLDEIIRMMQGR